MTGNRWRIFLALGFVVFLLTQALMALRGGHVFYIAGYMSISFDGYHFNICIKSFRTLLMCLSGAAVLTWMCLFRFSPCHLTTIPWVKPFALVTFLVIGLYGLGAIFNQVSFDYRFYTFLLAALLLVAYVVFRLRGIGLMEKIGALGSWRFWPLVAACLGSALMLFSHIYVFEYQPIITDSQSQIAQARLLSTGHFVLDVSQPFRDVISFPYAVRCVPSFSQYPPGYILPLTALCLLHLPIWVFDFVLAGLCTALIAVLGKRLGNPVVSVIAVLMLLTSPFFLCLSGSLMNHLFCAVLLLFVFYCFIPMFTSTERRPSWILFLAGIALGWSVLVRPVTGVVHLVTWMLFYCGLFVRSRRGSAKAYSSSELFRALVPVICGGLIMAGIFVFYNLKTTGDPFVLGYQISNPELHRLGFHGGATPYSVLDAWYRLGATYASMNFQTVWLGLGLTVWIVVWLFLSQVGRAEKIALLLIFAQVFVYACYQFYDLLMGPRFLFETNAFIILVLALGCTHIRTDLSGWCKDLLWVAFFILCLTGLFDGVDFWKIKYEPFVKRNRSVAEAVEKCLKNYKGSERLVMILDGEPEMEMIGRYFVADRYFFIKKCDEAKARQLPELKDAVFVVLQ